MKKNSGFTMLELMIIIAIVGLLTAIAIPNVISWRRNAAFRGAVNTLKSDLAMAKQAAIKHNANVVVQFEANGAYTIFVDDGGGTAAKNGKQDTGETTLVKRSATPAVSMGLNTLPKNGEGASVVVFNAKGLSTATTTVSVVLTAGSKNNSTVSVNRVGKINITW